VEELDVDGLRAADRDRLVPHGECPIGGLHDRRVLCGGFEERVQLGRLLSVLAECVSASLRGRFPADRRSPNTGLRAEDTQSPGRRAVELTGELCAGEDTDRGKDRNVSKSLNLVLCRPYRFIRPKQLQ